MQVAFIYLEVSLFTSLQSVHSDLRMGAIFFIQKNRLCCYSPLDIRHSRGLTPNPSPEERGAGQLWRIEVKLL